LAGAAGVAVVLLAAGVAAAQSAGGAEPLVLAQAQDAAAQPFNIPAQPLADALIAFGQQSGLQVTVDSALLAGLRSQAVSGSLAPDAALRRLIAGTGPAAQFSDAGTVALEKAPPGADTVTTLAPVTVETARPQETALGPTKGFVAARGAAATKTDTPLIETPQAISVVTRDQMEAQGAVGFRDALRYTAGVTGEPYGVDARDGWLHIRGFNVSKTGFFRDGLMVKNTPFTTVPIEPYALERIEVLRGPASVLFGQAQPGGLVNLVSKRPLAAPTYEVGIGYGTYDRYEGRFDIGGPIDEAGQFAYRLTAIGFDGDTQVDFVEHKRGVFAPTVAWRPNENTTLTIQGLYQRDDSGWLIQFYPAAGTALGNPNGKIKRSRFTGEPDFDEYKLTQANLGYLFEHKFADRFAFRQSARYSYLDTDQRGVFASGLQADNRTLNRYGDDGISELNGIAIDNQLEAKFATGAVAHTFLVGLDYQNYHLTDIGHSYDVDPIDIFNPVYGSAITNQQTYQDTDSRQRQVGLYAQEQLKIADRLVLMLGGRYDWARTLTDDRVAATTTRQKDTAFTGRVGVVYLFDSGLAPYASYGESFLPVLGTDASGQPFKPETGRQYEIGVKYQPPNLNAFITVAAFDLARQNALTRDPVNPTEQVQKGEITSRGIEIEAVASLDMGLRLIASYSYLEPEITKSNEPGEQGEKPVGIPSHTAALWADYKLQTGLFAGLGFGAGARYLGETYIDTPNSNKVDDALLFDAAIHYDLGGLRLGINAANLFDKRYVSSCSSLNACYYGERLRVLATARYRW
jgi:iron complex outermembrane receptor protein